MQNLKVHHYRGFHPRIHVIGREHIDTALERGRGTILWAGDFVSAPLVEPMALHQVGVPLYHLSNWYHGITNTRFAIRWLNPLITTAENRYLAERIVRTPGSFSALVTLQERLEENRVVGMRAIGAIEGPSRVLDLPFLDGRIAIATGAVELAMITGAEVLPMFAVCNDAGEYEVHVEASIPIRIGGDRKKAVADAAAEFVARLEPYVMSYPGQWIGWDRQVRAKDCDDDQTIVEMTYAEFRD
jgi:lauroyl/myristoyl acyltransferase